MKPTQLPDDIEQNLLDGQRLRATHALMERRGVTLDDARVLVGRWLFERQQANTKPTGGILPAEIKDLSHDSLTTPGRHLSCERPAASALRDFVDKEIAHGTIKARYSLGRR